jgi:PIN domain nuclease of toxin-antitoxin system
VTSSPPVLDASAVLAILRAEAGAQVVRSVLESAQQDSAPCPMTTVNWGEVLYKVGRRSGPAAVPPLIEKLDGLPIMLVDADRDLTVRAAMLKATRGLGYADAYCAALAMTLAAPVLTCDSDFDELERDGLIEVVRAR